MFEEGPEMAELPLNLTPALKHALASSLLTISGPSSSLYVSGSEWLNLASLNEKELREPIICACLLGELSNYSVDVAAVQETHFICTEDSRVLFSLFSIRQPLHSLCKSDAALMWLSDLSLQMMRPSSCDQCWRYKLRLLGGHSLCTQYRWWKTLFFSAKVKPFLDNLKQLVDPKLDWAERGASWSDWCESSIIYMLAEHDLVNKSGSPREEDVNEAK